MSTPRANGPSGRFGANSAYHGGDARASGVMGMSPFITAGDPAGFVSWRALRVSNFAQTAAVQAGIIPLRGASNQENVMKKMSMIGATLLGAAVLCAVPISLHQSQNKGLSLSLDSADARVGQPLSAGSVVGVHRRANRRAVRHGY